MLFKDNRKHLQLGSVAHAFNPAFGRQGQANIWGFEASLDYRLNSKTEKRVRGGEKKKKDKILKGLKVDSHF